MASTWSVLLVTVFALAGAADRAGASATSCRYPTFDMCFALDATASVYRGSSTDTSYPTKYDYLFTAGAMGYIADALNPKAPLGGGRPNARIAGVWFKAEGQLQWLLGRKKLFSPEPNLGVDRLTDSTYPSDAGHAPLDYTGPLKGACAKFNSKGACVEGKSDAVTDIAAGVRACAQLLAARTDKSRRAVIVLVTDGWANYKPRQSAPDPVTAATHAAAAAKKAGVAIITVGTGSYNPVTGGTPVGNDALLKRLASSPRLYLNHDDFYDNLQVRILALLARGDKCTPKPPRCKILEFTPADGKLYPGHLMKMKVVASTTTQGITSVLLANPFLPSVYTDQGFGLGQMLTASSSNGMKFNELVFIAPKSFGSIAGKNLKVKFTATDSLGRQCVIGHKVKGISKRTGPLPTCKVTKVEGLKKGAIMSGKMLTIHAEASSANKSTTVQFFNYIRYLGGSLPYSQFGTEGKLGKVMSLKAGKKGGKATVALQWTPTWDCYYYDRLHPKFDCNSTLSFVFTDSAGGACRAVQNFKVSPAPDTVGQGRQYVGP